MKPEDYIEFEDRLPDCPCLVFGKHGVYWVLNHPAMHDLSHYKSKGMTHWMPVVPPNVDYDLRDNCCFDCVHFDAFIDPHNEFRTICDKGHYETRLVLDQRLVLKAKKCTDFELK